MYVLVYLTAIVAANLALTTYGPVAALPVGFALIGLELATRDKLHDQWANSSRAGFALRMGGLIATGGALSYAFNADAAQVAIASTVAFTVAALLDAAAYTALRSHRPWIRSAGSNVPAAAADSWLFLALAFPGAAPLLLVAGQFLVKTLGGLVWSLILFRPRRRPDTLHDAIMVDLHGVRE